MKKAELVGSPTGRPGTDGTSPEHRVPRIERDFDVSAGEFLWDRITPLLISHYQWLDNGYAPRVEVRLCYSECFLYVFFKVQERRVRVRYLRFQDPVWKDSCVEFFIDAFPQKKRGYMNFETNALGTLLVAIGPGREGRQPIPRQDLQGFETAASLKGPLDSDTGSDFWTLKYRIPLALFQKYYGARISRGHEALANFYKCGDETEFSHYGSWSPITWPKPDFHRPEFFGRLVFE